MRNNRLTIWAIGLMLAALGAIGMQSCGKEDAPEPPKQQEPTKPDNPDTPDDPDTSDSIRKPFDPNKPYKPVNKLLQVFKNGYPSTKILYGVYSIDPTTTEFIIDDNNNLVKVIKNDRIYVEFEYGHFTDLLGNAYQVKYTRHDWNDEYGDETVVYLCKLNEDEMIVDLHLRRNRSGYFFEYENGHIVKEYSYTCIGGVKVVESIIATYQWDGNTMIQCNNEKIDYSTLVENHGALLSCEPTSSDHSYGIDECLYMAALMGSSSQYIPTSYSAYPNTRCYINEIQLNSNGLPLKVILSKKYYGKPKNYSIQYVWQDLNKK